MKSDSLVSVIVPAYNVELYIDKCLRSIISQTYSNIEVIVIIDGAKDKSEEIARSVASEDDRISVFWQKNAGSGPARNYGLSIAKGEYIMFVDPDDWVENNMIECLIDEIENEKVDLVTSGCITDLYKNGELVDNLLESFGEEIIRDKASIRNAYLRLFNMGALSAPTKKIYKKRIIDKYDVQFPDLRRSQDIVFNYRYYDCIDSIKISNASYYHYRVDDEENSRKIPPTYYKNIEFIYGDVCNLLTKWGVDKGKQEFVEFCNHFLYAIIALLKTLRTVDDISNITNNKAIRELVKYSNPNTAKQKIICGLIRMRANLILKLIVQIYH